MERHIAAVSKWSTSRDGTERRCFVGIGVTLEKNSGESNYRVVFTLKCKEKLVENADLRPQMTRQGGRQSCGKGVTSFSMMFAANKHEDRRLYVGNLGTIVMIV